MSKKDRKIELDNRVCMFYVADRLKDILEAKTEKELRAEVREMTDEMIHNLGINYIIKHYELDN
tara:strand:+ start:4130 stop:4321 length:192 start_codon:yes stop_codon:yes gene_type:complete